MTGTTLYDRYARVVTSHPRASLLMVALSVAVLGFCARNVRLDNNFAALFSTSSEAASFREHYRHTFGADDGLLIAVLSTEHPEEPGFVALVDELSRAAAKQDQVRRVYSPTETSVMFRQDDSAVIEPAFGSSSSFRGSFADRLRLILGSPLGGNRLLSNDGKVFLVVAELDPSIDSYETILEPATKFETLIRDQVQASKLPIDVHFAGIPYTRIAAIASMIGDLALLTPLTTLALALMLAVFFRRVVAVMIPLACVTASIVGTAGFIGLAGDNLNQLTVVYPILLMVITVATAIHQVHRFQDELERLGDVHEAALVAAARTTEASFLQTLTTIFGFGSLVTSSMHILHGFGLYLAAGVALAFFYVATLVPASLVLWGKWVARTTPHAASAAAPSTANERYVRWLVKPSVSRAVSGASLVAFVGLCWLARDIVYDYRLSDNVPRGHQVEAGNLVLDSQLAGIVPIEVAVQGPADAFRQPENLRKLEQLASFLHDQEQVNVPITLATVVRELNRNLSGRNELPSSSDAVSQLLLFADGSPDRIVQQLSTADLAQTRVRGTMPDRGARYVAGLEKRFAAFATTVLADSGLKARMTGEAPVAYEGMNRLSEELLTSELWALVLVTLSIGIVFRSTLVALASVLPNALPVLIALTFYALTDRAIDPLPGIVFCIGIGIAVDDTIHVLARYREELQRGTERRLAMVQTMTSMSGALLSSSAAIAAGFLVLCLSDFNMNRTMGWLGALMLALAWLFEMVCTPAALVLFEWKVSKQPGHEPLASGGELPVTGISS